MLNLARISTLQKRNIKKKFINSNSYILENQYFYKIQCSELEYLTHNSIVYRWELHCIWLCLDYKPFFLAFTTRWRSRPTSANKPTLFGPKSLPSTTWPNILALSRQASYHAHSRGSKLEQQISIHLGCRYLHTLGQLSDYIWNFFPVDLLTFSQVNLPWKLRFRSFRGPQPRNDTPVYFWPRYVITNVTI